MKVLHINYDSNWGSEKELNVFVTKEYSSWEEIQTIEEFVLALIRYNWVFEEDSNFRFTVEDLDKISNANFENIIENYDYIQKLRINAKLLGIEPKFKELVYKLENTKFGFRQEIVLFNNIHFVTQNVDIFRKKVVDRLKPTLPALVENDGLAIKKIELEKKIGDLKYIIGNKENAIDKIKKEIDKFVEELQQLQKQLKELES